MATNTDQTQGYRCEFIDEVPDDFYCKKCSAVARSLTVCSFCMESYCYDCICDIKEQGQPCPSCDKKDFLALPQVKYQKRMKELRVYCSLKERGCGWSGTLDQLDTHLDPDQDNCQYVDTKCPLHCERAIPKNKVEQHVAEECVKRDYICKYCSFKASYEEVVDKHLPECKKVILPCPNNCETEIERGQMENHKKICRLEEIECEFSGVGCRDRFRREDQEEHTRQNSHKHLTLTASLAKQLQQKIEEQDEKHREEEMWTKKTEEQQELLKKRMEGQRKTLEKKIEGHEKRIREQERKINEQDYKMEKQAMVMEEQRTKIKELEQKLEEHQGMMEDLKLASPKQAEQTSKGTPTHKTRSTETRSVEEGRRIMRTNSEQKTEQTFEISYNSTKQRNGCSTPEMYTHVYGYKFYIRVYISAHNFLCAELVSVPGEYDNQLQWPARMKFLIKLLHQQGETHKETADTSLTWTKPTHESKIFSGMQIGDASQLDEYLLIDTLRFSISTTNFM